MNICQPYDTFVIRDLCKIIRMPDQFWTDFMEHTHPKVICPFTPGIIKVTNATVDLGYLSYLPLDGYIWNFSFKAFQSITKTKDKNRMLYCGSAKINITKAHNTRKKN